MTLLLCCLNLSSNLSRNPGFVRLIQHCLRGLLLSLLLSLLLCLTLIQLLLLCSLSAIRCSLLSWSHSGSISCCCSSRLTGHRLRSCRLRGVWHAGAAGGDRRLRLARWQMRGHHRGCGRDRSSRTSKLVGWLSGKNSAGFGCRYVLPLAFLSNCRLCLSGESLRNSLGAWCCCAYLCGIQRLGSHAACWDSGSCNRSGCWFVCWRMDEASVLAQQRYPPQMHLVVHFWDEHFSQNIIWRLTSLPDLLHGRLERIESVRQKAGEHSPG
mmetsp:Transcript_10283/g.23487  ORF Transcript_10283/g.23487 Transcript_10283/m.23487 type:complete len:268 (+) Transcript_10283:990-1793(+)